MKIETIKSGAPRPLANYNECFKVGPWVFAAGQIASDYKTGVAPEARKKPAFPYYGSDIKLQTHYVLGNLKKTFEAAGSSLDHVVKAQVFMTDLANFNAFDEVWREYFKVPPARTTVGTTGLLVPGTLVEIDLIGYVPGQGIEHKAVKSARAAAARELHRGVHGRQPDLRGRAAGERLQDRHPGRGAARTRRFRSTARTSRSRPASSWTISSRPSRRPAARSTRCSRRRCSSPTSTTSTPSTRSGRSISRCRRRARPSARPGCWSRDSLIEIDLVGQIRQGREARGGHVEQSQAARQLHRGVPRRRPGVRGGTDRLGLRHRRRPGGAGSIRHFRITARRSRSRPATSSTT